MIVPATNRTRITRKQAAKRLLRLDDTQNDIISFAKFIDVPGRLVAPEDDDSDEVLPVETPILADHHELILRSAYETSRTPHGRLMLFFPPGSAKTTYASVVFPAMFMGERPGNKIILGTYGDDLAKKMGRRTRAILQQPRYFQIFGTKLDPKKTSAQDFGTLNGSEYMSAGMRTGITGNRAHGIIIDDPVKGREDADSEKARRKTWDIYVDDVLTRLLPGGWIIIIQTRWHQDDLSGRILPEDWRGESGLIECRDGNTWNVVCVQAQCETDSDPLGRNRGEFLWPEWFDERHWNQFKHHSLTWASLFQQIPSPGDGNIFKPDRIEIVDAIPSEARDWVRGWDLAASDEAERSFTAGAKWAKIPAGTDGKKQMFCYILADIERQKLTVDGRDNLIVNTAKMDGRRTKTSLPQDPGQAGKSQKIYFARMLAGHRVVFSPESGSKITRAEPLAAQVNAGNVKMLRAPWNRALLEEMRNFPVGKHDDQVDACSRAFSELCQQRRGYFG